MRLISAVFFLLCVLSIQFCHAELDWPMVNGCRERTSWAEDEWALSPPFDDPIIHDVAAEHLVYSDHVLYLSRGGSPNTIVAYDLEAEVELWEFNIDGSGGSCGCVPAVGDSLVYCGGQNGLGLFALDKLTGEIEWMKELGGLYTRNPIIDGDRVYVVKDSLYCFESASGITLWTYPISGQLTPAIDEINVYVATGGTTLALDKFSGELQWTVPVGQRLTIGLSVDDHATYSFEGSRIVSRRKSDGEALWEYQTSGNIAWLDAGALAVSDSFLSYVHWEDTLSVGRVTALDKHTGLYQWHHSFDGPGAFTPVIANDVVYVIEDDSHWLFGFDLHDGSHVFTDSSVWYNQDVIVANHSLFAAPYGSIREFRNPTHSDLAIPDAGIVLEQNYPNPCSNLALIPFRLEESGIVRFMLTDIAGRTIRIIEHSRFAAGRHGIAVGTSDLAPGTYIYRIETAGQATSRRLTVVR